MNGCVVDKSRLDLIGVTLVYAELIAYGSDRVDMPDKKVQVYILYGMRFR